MTPGKLFLSGGGDIPQSHALDSAFFAELPHSARILYVPLALNRSSWGFKFASHWFASLIQRHTRADGDPADFTMLLEGDSVPDLATYDAIYLGGGNTFKLRQYVETTFSRERLAEFHGSGKPIYGGSAGAILFGKSLQTVCEENDAEYPLTEGLGWLGEASLLCHYIPGNAFMQDDIIDKTFLYGLPLVYALPEESGIIVAGTDMVTVGTTYVFTGISHVPKEVNGTLAFPHFPCKNASSSAITTIRKDIRSRASVSVARRSAYGTSRRPRPNCPGTR